MVVVLVAPASYERREYSFSPAESIGTTQLKA